ncbi:MAG TPA: hypothetical protein VMN58_12630 [Acidimicrobiales bacterium]|nr:hypothetical protein [Acidimicrobiales bacterium]
MYFYTRMGRVRPGRMADATGWAVDLTGRVNQVTGLRVGLWTTMFSPGVGTMAWSTFVPDLMTLDEANGKLMADQAFLAEVERGGEIFTEAGMDDSVAQLVHTAGEPVTDPRYASIVLSGMAAGGFGKGIEVGIEIAERATRLSGISTSFLVAATGPYAGCAWIAASETLDALDSGERAVNSNPDFIAYLDEAAADVYRPEISTQTLWSRIT